MVNTFTKPQIQQKALQKALQSPQIGKHGKRKETLALERALDKKAENIAEDMLIERSRIINSMRNKRSKASYRDLIHAFDILTKNILLLSGGNTGRVGIGTLLDEIEEENKNTIKFEWGG